MPTYDYRCAACGHALEIFHSMLEAKRRKCPACGKLALERQIGSGAGILFKGQGFYETDYRSASYQAAAQAEAAPAEKPASSEGATPAAKPEPTPAAKPAAEKGSSSARKKPAGDG